MRRAAALTVLLVTGCATVGEDGGFRAVEQLVEERTGMRTQWIRSDDEAIAVRTRTKELLAKPLTAEDAVQVALTNNPGLQASYAELGVAAGDLLGASVLPNPRLGYLRTRNGDEAKIEAVLSFNILSLLTVPIAYRAQKERFEQIKLVAATDAVRVASETRKAYFRAVAAQQVTSYMEEVKAAAEAAAELARRMAAIGNLSKLDRMREQAFYADAAAQLARARQAAVTERERLVRLMGLWGEDARFQLPQRMPDLPAAPRELPRAEQLAMEQRLDVRAARRDAGALASSLGLTRVTRFTDEFELGMARTTETPEPRKKGYEIGVEIPLFDWGSGRIGRAEALYMQAATRIAEAAINARSEVREAYDAYRNAYDVTKHYRDEVVPLRRQISEEVLLRYNGMLASTFELLIDAREQVLTVSAYIESLREYWVRDAELQMALTGSSPGAAGAGAVMTAAPSAAAGPH